MNFFDLFIIYFACGAPFGVYFYLNRRSAENRIFFKTALVSLFWIPFAIKLTRKYITKRFTNSILAKKDFVRDEEILKAKKDLENVFIKNKFDISIFELREIFDRYTGLTETALNQDDSVETDSEFFEVAGNKNIRLASKCHQRRNRKLLFFHHTVAGQDFLKVISEFVARFPNDERIGNAALKLVGILNDETTEKSLKLILKNKMQSREEIHVQKPEKDLWIHDLQQPPTADALRISVNTAGARTNSLLKD